jgi:hypothetical protein
MNCILGCIFTWSGSSSYVNNPLYAIVIVIVRSSLFWKCIVGCIFNSVGLIITRETPVYMIYVEFAFLMTLIYILSLGMLFFYSLCPNRHSNRLLVQLVAKKTGTE